MSNELKQLQVSFGEAVNNNKGGGHSAKGMQKKRKSNRWHKLQEEAVAEQSDNLITQEQWLNLEVAQGLALYRL